MVVVCDLPQVEVALDDASERLPAVRDPGLPAVIVLRGVLVKLGNDWKISQYALTFPIPNDLAKGMTDQIKAFESRTHQ